MSNDKFIAKRLGKEREELIGLPEGRTDYIKVDALGRDYSSNRAGRKEIPIWDRIKEHTIELDGCYLFVPGDHPIDGYKYIWYKGKYHRIHRLVWVLSGRTLTPGMTLDHTCEIKSCWNLDHLEEVTYAENKQREVARRLGR